MTFEYEEVEISPNFKRDVLTRVTDAVERVFEFEVLALELQLAGLHLGVVKDVIDDIEQDFTRFKPRPDELLLLFIKPVVH